MTDKEQKEYNKLSPHGKKYYDRDVEDFPNRSHSQHMMKAKVGEMLDKPTEPGINPVEIIKLALKQAKKWLEDFCDISNSVLCILDDAISALGDAILDGIVWVGDKIANILSRIFD